MSLRPPAESGAASETFGGTASFRSTASFIAEASEFGNSWLVPLSCLIVDDNDEFLDSSSRVLESQGLHVVGRASAGNEAVRLAEELRPDVALVDVRLGEEDGVEVARQLAARALATRVVLISTHADDEVPELLADSPAVGFLPKAALSAEAVAELVR